MNATQALELIKGHLELHGDDEGDDASRLIRDFIDIPDQIRNQYADDYEGLTKAQTDEIAEALQALWDDKFSRGTLTELAISMSLCPLHFVDWAICFDDTDPECSQIREIYPYSHDT